MSEFPERVASGPLRDLSASVYTVPRHTRIVLTSLVLTNTSEESVEVGAAITIDALPGVVPASLAAAVPVLPQRLVLGAGDSYHLSTPIAVDANQHIVLSSTKPNAVQFYLSAIKMGALPVATDRGV